MPSGSRTAGQFALSEGGIGWIPFLLQRFEDIYGRQRAWTGDDLGDGLTPTDCFVETSSRASSGTESASRTGIASASKRFVGRWIIHTRTRAGLMPLNSSLRNLRAAVPMRSKPSAGATANAFGYTGVERLGRKNCTVRSLRQQVADKDLSTPKVDVDRIPKPGTQALTYGEMKVRMATIMTGGTSS